MSAHNMYYHDKVGKRPTESQTICFLELSEELLRDSKTGSN